MKPHLWSPRITVSLSSLLNSYLLCHRKLSLCSGASDGQGGRRLALVTQMPQTDAPVGASSHLAQSPWVSAARVIHPRFNTLLLQPRFPSNQTHNRSEEIRCSLAQQIVFSFHLSNR